MSKYVMKPEIRQAPDWTEELMAEAVGADLLTYLAPLLMRLCEVLDKRVVRTFAQTILAIVRNRDRARCLIQTELGALLLGASKARAGAKRLRSLLCKLVWKSTWIETFMREEAERSLQQWEEAGVTPIAAWDGSVLEKHESWKAEGLCPVHSSKAARRTRLRKGYYHPPVGRICVPGLQWIGVVFTSRLLTQGHPVLAAMRFWTTRGAQRSWRRDEETRLMRELAAHFGRRIIHVFDRGFVGERWVRVCTLVAQVRFILRWTGSVHLVDEKGQCRAAWKAVIGKRQGQEQRVFWNARAHQVMRLRVAWTKVTHPSHPDQPLVLVVVRGYAQPWYRLDHRADQRRRRCLAGRARVSATLANRASVARGEKRVRLRECAHLGMGRPTEATLHGHARPCIPAALHGRRSAPRGGPPMALAARLSADGLALSADLLASCSLARGSLLAVAAAPPCLGHSPAPSASTALPPEASRPWGPSQLAQLTSRHDNRGSLDPSSLFRRA